MHNIERRGNGHYAIMPLTKGLHDGYSVKGFDADGDLVCQANTISLASSYLGVGNNAIKGSIVNKRIISTKLGEMRFEFTSQPLTSCKFRTFEKKKVKKTRFIPQFKRGASWLDISPTELHTTIESCEDAIVRLQNNNQSFAQCLWRIKEIQLQ